MGLSGGVGCFWDRDSGPDQLAAVAGCGRLGGAMPITDPTFATRPTTPHPYTNPEPTTYYVDCVDRKDGSGYTLEIPAGSAEEAVSMASRGHLVDASSVRMTREPREPARARAVPASPDAQPAQEGAAALAALLEIRNELRTINERLTAKPHRVISRGVFWGILSLPILLALLAVIIFGVLGLAIPARH